MGQRRLRRHIGQVMEEVKSSINSMVAAPTDEQFLLTKEEAVNAIRKRETGAHRGQIA